MKIITISYTAEHGIDNVLDKKLIKMMEEQGFEFISDAFLTERMNERTLNFS